MVQPITNANNHMASFQEPLDQSPMKFDSCFLLRILKNNAGKWLLFIIHYYSDLCYKNLKTYKIGSLKLWRRSASLEKVLGVPTKTFSSFVLDNSAVLKRTYSKVCIFNTIV